MDEHPPSGPKTRDAVTYKGRSPASAQASSAARGSSKKTNTACELALRRALWGAGYRYRKNVADVPGRPDIVFQRARVAIFCDGDFWHGNNWEARRHKLQGGSNPDYWIAKIQRNMERDQETTTRLESSGWTVLRFWESEIRAGTLQVVQAIAATLAKVLDKTDKMP